MQLAELHKFWGTKETETVRQKTLMMLSAGVILGIITPYETDNLPHILLRFLYWVGLVGIGSLLSGPVARLVFPQLIRRNISPLMGFALFTATISAPLFLFVLLGDIILGGLFIEPQAFTIANLLKYFADVEFGPIGYVYWYGQVWIVVLLILGPVSLLAEKFNAGKATPSAAPPGHNFLKRLPSNLGTELVCLSMEDHYIRVHTAKGNTLILMRMADALTELADYDGIQTHRSWWVAIDAIKHVVKDKRKYNVMLTNGLTAPVSQSHVDKMKQAGLI